MKAVHEIIAIVAILEVAFLLYLLYLKNSIEIRSHLPPPNWHHHTYRGRGHWADDYDRQLRYRSRTSRENAQRTTAAFIFVLILIGIFMVMARGA
jgi:hypothetical protein